MTASALPIAGLALLRVVRVLALARPVQLVVGAFTTLPQVNELNPKYLDYIIEDEDSVIRRWLALGASGWRLDVADELPDAFIQKLNAAARREKPDALIVGEVWEDASNKVSYSVRRRYFQGGELDSVMNYPLRDGVLSFLGGSPAEDFAEKMECLRENYPRAVFYNLMNIIGTHGHAARPDRHGQ